MNRIFIAAVLFASLCPTLSFAGDLTPMQRMAALTSNGTEKQMTPKPSVKIACLAIGADCSAPPNDCCTGSVCLHSDWKCH